MLETLLIIVVAAYIAVGVTQEAVVPVAKQVVEVANPVVEKVIEYVQPSKPKE